MFFVPNVFQVFPKDYQRVLNAAKTSEKVSTTKKKDSELNGFHNIKDIEDVIKIEGPLDKTKYANLL